MISRFLFYVTEKIDSNCECGTNLETAFWYSKPQSIYYWHCLMIQKVSAIFLIMNRNFFIIRCCIFAMILNVLNKNIVKNSQKKQTLLCSMLYWFNLNRFHFKHQKIKPATSGISRRSVRRILKQHWFLIYKTHLRQKLIGHDPDTVF